MEVQDLVDVIERNTLHRDIGNIVSKLKTDPTARSKLVTLSQMHESDTLHGALEIAFEYDPHWSILTLSFLLDNEDEEVRANFCGMLGSYPYPENEGLLAEVLKRENSGGVRCVAVEALGEVGSRAAIPVLQDIIATDRSVDYEGRPISELAQQSVQKITNRI